MASGTTVSNSLADSLPTIRQAARLFEEDEVVVTRTVDMQKLGKGEGSSWSEVRIEQISAQGITENTINDNPAMFEDAVFSVQPTMVQVYTRITDVTMRRISRNVAALLGRGAQLAMNRKLDEDGLAQYSNFTSAALCGTATTLSFGHIAAGVAQILGNATEGGAGAGPIHCVLHQYGIKDLQDEIVSGVGTYVVSDGLTEEIYRRGFSGTVAGANVWNDQNITVDGTPDARGAVYAQRALVLVKETEMVEKTRYRPEVGGGAQELFLTWAYAYGERRDVWGASLLHDATAPTA